METVKDFENFLVNLKEGDLPFLNEKKFESLMMTIIDVLNIQKTVGKSKIEEKTKQIGRNQINVLAFLLMLGFKIKQYFMALMLTKTMGQPPQNHYK
jgi:hypothetical protein